MRLIDADAIKWDKCEDADGNPVYVLDKRDIDAQPTAYDLDKVLEQLEYQKSIWNHDEVADQKMVEAKQKAYDMAIKIVKGGGVDE